MERDQILQLLFNEIPIKGEKLNPNMRKLLFSIFTLIIVPLAAYFIVGNLVSNVVFEYKSVAVVYTIFIFIGLLFGFKNYSLFINNQHIIKQSGAWDIDNEIIKIEVVFREICSVVVPQDGLIFDPEKATIKGPIPCFIGFFNEVGTECNRGT
jgi:putative membrane protein